MGTHTPHSNTHTHTLTYHPPPFAQNRPSDFFPVEYAGLRGIDQKMFKELETMNLKAEKDIYQTYKNCYLSLPTHDTVFFPARVGGGGGGGMEDEVVNHLTARYGHVL